nr:putative retrotransposon Ty1-copia subclass protein [Tanacetum cinerariifolium]
MKVENQLGKTIKELRSDRGGEYISQAFKDYLKAYGIVQQLTPPYTPQHNAVGRAKELEEIQDKDTLTFENTSEIPMEVEGFELPQEEVVPIQVEEYSLGDLNEPANYKAAILYLKFNKWVDAMNAKIQSIKDNQVWCLVKLPPNCKIVGSKWLFKKKTDMDGIVHTNKARLVAKGYTQTNEVNYEETLLPVAKTRAIRILIAIATFYDCKIWQMDVKTALLNGYLNEDIYMVQHEEVEYIAASEVIKEAIWIRKFISGLGIVPTINEPIKMFCDNSAELLITNEPMVQRGVKNYHRRYHYVHECIELGKINLLKVHTDEIL